MFYVLICISMEGKSLECQNIIYLLGTSQVGGVRKIIFSTPKIIKSNFSQNLMWVTPIFIAEMDSAFKITTRQWISKHLNHKFRSQNTFSVWFWKFSRTGPKWSNSIEQLEPKFIQFTKKCCSNINILWIFTSTINV